MSNIGINKPLSPELFPFHFPRKFTLSSVKGLTTIFPLLLNKKCHSVEYIRDFYGVICHVTVFVLFARFLSDIRTL
jgi:hypothetical protein